MDKDEVEKFALSSVENLLIAHNESTDILYKTKSAFNKNDKGIFIDGYTHFFDKNDSECAKQNLIFSLNVQIKGRSKPVADNKIEVKKKHLFLNSFEPLLYFRVNIENRKNYQIYYKIFTLSDFYQWSLLEQDSKTIEFTPVNDDNESIKELVSSCKDIYNKELTDREEKLYKEIADKKPQDRMNIFAYHTLADNEIRKDLLGSLPLAGILINFNGDKNKRIAKEYLEESLKLSKKLAESGTNESQRDLSISYDSVAGILINLGGAENIRIAKEYLEESLKLRKKLAESGTNESLRYLSVSYRNLFIFLMDKNDILAFQYMKECYNTYKKIIAANSIYDLYRQEYSMFRQEILEFIITHEKLLFIMCHQGLGLGQENKNWLSNFLRDVQES